MERVSVRRGGHPVMHRLRCVGAILVALTLAACVQAEPGRFIGKYELVPLFDAGHRPVIKNGHQQLAERNPVIFVRPNGEAIVIPAGMTTDLASIPPVLWPLLPPDGAYGQASGPHDLCYQTHGTFIWHGHILRTRLEPYARRDCDDMLLEGMVALHVPRWEQTLVYDGVRLGGAGGYGR